MDRYPIDLTVGVAADGHPLITVGGELDRWTGALLTMFLEGCEPPTTVDVSAVTFCDAGGYRHLRAAAQRGLTVDLEHASERVRTVIRLAGLDTDRLADPTVDSDA